MNRRDFLAGCARCAACAAASVPASAAYAAADMFVPAQGLPGQRPSPYFKPLDRGLVRCTLCPRECVIGQGERGHCDVRQNIGGELHTLVYGNPCAVHVDPIEKKPFFHVLPGSLSFSIATAGCNMDCKFCQNWEISQAAPENTFNYDMPPETAVDLAGQYGCASIASTYVEPTIFMEYMLDIGRCADKAGIMKVMHSNGYVNRAPLDDLCRSLDAACIDLKGFTEKYYLDMTGGSLAPVLDTLVRLRDLGVHTELVTLIIPGHNDDTATIREMCRWIARDLDPGTPLHFSRFYPMYRLTGVQPTPVSTLETARNTALEQGLDFVYIGNVPGHEASHTYCPGCGQTLIRRIGYRAEILALTEGRCTSCNREIPGIWNR